MKPCIECAHPTHRHDNLCPNCYFVKPDSDNPQSFIESITIPHEKYICECGESRTRALILMTHGFAFMQPGAPKSNGMKYRDSRAIMVEGNPSLWYARCYNCQARINRRPPGRPKKYTDEERKWNKANAPKIYFENLKRNVILSYGSKGAWPTCLHCNSPATRVLYVGEFGKAPIGNHYWRCRRQAIKDPYWHSQFLPFCQFHEVSNVGQRHKQWKAIVKAISDDTLMRSSRSFAEMERLGLV